MEHHHDHHHHTPIQSLNKAFIIGIILNSAFVITEFLAGFHIHSLGLISDAGHNLSDVASLILAMLAFRLSKVSSSKKYTYGYKKSTILVSLLNAIILLVAVGAIIYESIEKIRHPQPISGNIMVYVAGIGIIINALTAWLFIKDKDKDLNIKGAYLHMAADALVSVGVVIAGIIMIFTDYAIIDPIIGLIVAGVIVFSTWNLLKSSMRLSLDGVPQDINMDEIKSLICKQSNVLEVHHLHIWALSTTENALTAHIVIANLQNLEETKRQIKDELSHKGI